MPEENQSKSYHLTELDFDISKIPNQLEDISDLLNKYVTEYQNKFSGIDISFNTGEVKTGLDGVKLVFNNVIQDITDQQDIISKVFSKEDIDKAKRDLQELLKATGEIGKIKIVSDSDSETLKATVDVISASGQKSTEVFKLQNRAIGDVIDGVQQYEKVWQKTTETIEQNFAKQESNYKSDLKYINQLLEAQKDLTTKYSVGKYAGDNGAVLRKQSQELEKQLEIIKQQVIANKQFTEEEKRQTEEIVSQVRQLKRESVLMPGKESSIFETLIGRVKWSASFDMTRKAEETLRYTLETLKEVEFSVMEITRVLNDSSLNTKQFTSDLFDMAVEYGRTFGNATEVTLRFAQAGYNAADSMEMAKTTMLALNTAELNVEQSTNSLIGILKQWNLESEDFALVVDKINYAADNYAVTSQDLVDGLLRSSSAARLAKLSFDETIGALVAMRETSGRTGKEVGTAFNSLISYTQRAKTLDVFESLGVKVYADESKETLMPLLDVWEQLSQKVKQGGDSVVATLERHTDLSNLMSKEVAAATGTLEEFNLAMEEENELRAKGLTDMEKQAVYEQAGTHRRNYFIALLENFNRIQEVANDLQNAEGHSMAENSKYMDTLTARYNEFISSLQALANEAGNNGLMGLAKDLLSVATALTKAAKSSASLPALISAITFSMTLLNKETKLFGLIQVKSWSDFKKFSLEGTRSVKDFVKGLKTQNAELIKAKLNTIGLKAATGLLNAAISAGTTILIEFAIKGIAYIINYSEKMAEKFDELTNKARGLSQEFKDSVSTINSVKREFAELAEGVDSFGNNLSLSADEYKRYKDISNQLADIAPELVKGFDSEGNAILNLSGNVETVVEKLDDYIVKMKEANNLEILSSAEETFKSYRVVVEDLERELDDLESRRISAQKTFDTSEDISGLYEYLNVLDNAGIKYKQITEMNKENLHTEITVVVDEDSVNKANFEIDKAINAKNREIATQTAKMRPVVQAALELDIRYDQLEKNTQQFFDAIIQTQRFRSNEEMQGFIDDWLGKLNENQSMVDEAVTQLFSAQGALKAGEITSEKYIQIIEEQMGKLKSVIPDDAFQKVKDSWIGVVNAIEAGTTQLVDEQSIFQAMNMLSEEYAEAVENISKNIDSLRNAFSTLNSVVEEYNSSGSVSLETLQKIINLNPQYVSLLYSENGALKLNEQAFRDLAIAEIEEAKAKQLQYALDTISKIKSETDALAILSAQNLTAAVAANTFNQEIINQIDGLQRAGTITEETAGKLLGYADAINKVFDSAKEKVTITSPPTDFLSVGGSVKGGGGGGKSWYDTQAEAFERLNRMGQKNTQQVVDFYRQMTKSANISAADRIKAEDKLFDAIKKQIQESLKLQLEALNKQKESIEEIAKGQIDKLNKRKEQISEEVDAEIDGLRKVQDEKDRLREYEEYQRNLAEAKLDLASAQRRSGIEARRQEAEALKKIEELDRNYQQKLEDYAIEDKIAELEAYKNAQIAAIEDEIAAIEERKQAEIEAIDERIQYLNDQFNEANINMMSYAMLYSEELYNKYVGEFIEPMANGLYNGFLQANDLMEAAASRNAAALASIYSNNFIAPMRDQLAQLQQEMNNIHPKMDDLYWQNFKLGASDGSDGASGGGNRSITNNYNVRTYNSISDKTSADFFARKIVEKLGDSFGSRI